MGMSRKRDWAQAARDEYAAPPTLRNPIVPAVYDPLLDAISEIAEGVKAGGERTGCTTYLINSRHIL